LNVNGEKKSHSLELWLSGSLPSMLLPAAFEFGLHQRGIRLFEGGREELIRSRERWLFTGCRMHDDLSWMSERQEGSCQKQQEAKHCR
jgi:hypothetical protein